MTKIAGDDDYEDIKQNIKDSAEGLEDSLVTMEPRGYCYIPFILHFGLSEKQSSSFFQLCRIAGISFDL